MLSRVSNNTKHDGQQGLLAGVGGTQKKRKSEIFEKNFKVEKVFLICFPTLISVVKCTGGLHNAKEYCRREVFEFGKKYISVRQKNISGLEPTLDRNRNRPPGIGRRVPPGIRRPPVPPKPSPESPLDRNRNRSSSAPYRTDPSRTVLRTVEYGLQYGKAVALFFVGTYLLGKAGKEGRKTMSSSVP